MSTTNTPQIIPQPLHSRVELGAARTVLKASETTKEVNGCCWGVVREVSGVTKGVKWCCKVVRGCCKWVKRVMVGVVRNVREASGEDRERESPSSRTTGS